MSQVCTCANLDCPLHPSRHDKGCTPCISKNLKLKEVPNCFFNLLDGADDRDGDSLVSFAKEVLASEKRKCFASHGENLADGFTPPSPL